MKLVVLCENSPLKFTSTWTLISCRGEEKTLSSQRTFGRSTNWTRLFVEMNLARVPGIEANLYLVLVLYHSLNHQYIENPYWSAAVGSHPGDCKSQQTKSFIDCNWAATSFDSFFRVENSVAVVSTFRGTRSACGHQTTIGRASSPSETWTFRKVLKIGYNSKISHKVELVTWKGSRCSRWHILWA